MASSRELTEVKQVMHIDILQGLKFMPLKAAPTASCVLNYVFLIWDPNLHHIYWNLIHRNIIPPFLEIIICIHLGL